MAIDAELEALIYSLERDADEVRTLLDPTRSGTGPEVLSGGRLADSLDEVIDVSQEQLRDMAQRLDATAAELRQIGEEQAFDEEEIARAVAGYRPPVPVD